MRRETREPDDMLYTASFYDPHHWVGQPFRVSRAHPRGRRAQWETLPCLYPPLDLLRAYQGAEIDFTELSEEYRANLDQKLVVDIGLRRFVERLPGLGDVTLLCFERGNEPCHRRVAARWLEEHVPGLTLGELR